MLLRKVGNMLKEKMILSVIIYMILGVYCFFPEKSFLIYFALSAGVIAMFSMWHKSLMMVMSGLWISIFSIDKIIQQDVLLACFAIGLTPVAILSSQVTKETLGSNINFIFANIISKILSFSLFFLYCLVHVERPVGGGPVARLADMSTDFSECMLLFISAGICVKVFVEFALDACDANECQCYPGCQFDEDGCPSHDEKSGGEVS